MIRPSQKNILKQRKNNERKPKIIPLKNHTILEWKSKWKWEEKMISNTQFFLCYKDTQRKIKERNEESDISVK